MTVRTIGPTTVWVDSVKEGTIVSFVDKNTSENNGYPMAEQSQWDDWINLFGGGSNSSFVLKNLKSWSFDFNNKTFANLSQLAELSGGRGLSYSVENAMIIYGKSTGPTAKITPSRYSCKVGESITFNLSARNYALAYHFVDMTFKDDKGGIYLNNKRYLSDTANESVTKTFSSAGNYLFSLNVNDGVFRYTCKQMLISVTTDDPIDPVQPPEPPPIIPPEPPEAENLPPNAVFSLPSTSYEGDTVDIGEHSFDLDGEIVDWDWDYNPHFAGSTNMGEDGGTITINSIGKYDVSLTVTDDDGATDTVTHSINVIKAEPEAVIGYNGTLKENRLVNLYSTNSISSESCPIDHARDEWTVTPISGGTAADIKWGIRLGASQQMLFKKAGAYRVGLRVHNEKYDSEWAYKDIIITPDDPPIANFFKTSIAFRNPAVGNSASITLNDRSFSLDGDNISERIWKYKYDSNNDGSFLDEAWVILTIGNIEKPVLTVNKVGKYLVELTVKESFGQPTIPAFITDPDYRRGDTTAKPQADKIIDVQNIAPVTTFTALLKPLVDISFSQGYLDDFKTRFPSMVNYLEPVAGTKFKAKNVDYAFYNTTAAATNTPENFYFHSQIVSGSFPYSASNYFGNFYMANPADEYWGSPRLPYEPVPFEYIYFDLGKTVSRDSITNFKVIANGEARSVALQVSADGVNWIGSTYLFSTWSVGPIALSKEILPSDLPLSEFRYIRTVCCLYTNNLEIRVTLNGDKFDLQRFFYFGSPPEDELFLYTSRTIDLGQSFSTSAINNFDIYQDSGPWIATTYYLSQDGINWSYIQGGSFGGLQCVNTILKTNIPISSFRYIKIDFEVYVYGADRITLNFSIVTEDYSRATLSDIRARANAVYRENSTRYIVALAEEPFTDADAASLDTTAALLNDKNIGLIAFTNNASLASLQQLTSKLDKQSIIITASDLSTAIGQLADYVLSKTSTTASYGPFYILLGQSLGFNPSYSDYENDPKVTDNWSYVHNPNYVDNNTGVSFYNNKILSGPVATLDKVGMYDVQYKAQDDPTITDLRFLNYRLWSEPTPTNIIVHRKPIADFSVQAGTVNVTDLSYDPDFQFKRPDKGVVEWLWKWKPAASTAWTGGRPSGITALGNYVVRLEVKDVYGALSDPVEKNITVTTLRRPPVAGFNWTPTIICEGDTVTINNLSIDPDGDPLTYLWTVFDPVGGTSNYTTKDVALNKVLPGMYWVTLRASDPDGMSDAVTKYFVVDALGVKGYVKHTDLWNNHRKQYNQHFAGTDDSPRSYNTFWAGEEFVLQAGITDTGLSATKAQSVKVEFLYYGESMLLGPNAGRTQWNGEMWRDDFETIPDGLYIFRFTAAYSNGTVKSHEVSVVISGVWLDYYKFHRNW